MARVLTLGSVTLGVADLETSIDFFGRVVRLEVTERSGDTVFMSGGSGHHWIRLEESPKPGLERVSYQVADDETMSVIASDLSDRGISCEDTRDFASDRLDRSLRFADPAGVGIELYTNMAELPVPIEPNGITLCALLHTLWVIPNFDETLAFYQDVLGFQVSDAIDDAGLFLRCGDGYHHSLALGRGAPDSDPALGHICILVASLDDVMRYRNNALSLGLELELDVLKHPYSGSIGVYAKDPIHGFSIEFCTDHARIPEGQPYTPRRMLFGPAVLDVWKSPLPPPRVDTKVPFHERVAAQSAVADPPKG